MADLPRSLLLVVLALAGIEAISFAGGRVIVARRVLLDPPRAEGYADYLAARDPVLGWPAPASLGAEEVDSSGSRVVSSFPDPAQHVACGALFGDSFTWGADVSAEHAYGNVLSQRLGCRVENFGWRAYGTDQAYLRFLRTRTTAKFVVLGHHSENILRNVNRHRGFLYGSRFGFKPRFVLGEGGLELLPLPNLDEDEYLQLYERAEELLPREFFRPGGDAGIALFEFPYTLSVLRAFRHYRVLARLRGEAQYAAFYRPNHPSQALPLTAAILEAFVHEARTRGQLPVVLVIPYVSDLEALRDGDALPYAPLLTALRETGIETPDVAMGLLLRLHGREPDALYSKTDMARHFTAEGYAALADIVDAWLREHRYLEEIGAGAARSASANPIASPHSPAAGRY